MHFSSSSASIAGDRPYKSLRVWVKDSMIPCLAFLLTSKFFHADSELRHLGRREKVADILRLYFFLRDQRNLSLISDAVTQGLV